MGLTKRPWFTNAYELPFLCIYYVGRTTVINHSLISGTFPEKFIVARVIPILKKGNLEDVKCYRPVSLLPVFKKMLEKLVFNQFSKYLETNELLDKQQHGYRSHKSTITAGVELLNLLLNLLIKVKR